MKTKLLLLFVAASITLALIAFLIAVIATIAPTNIAVFKSLSIAGVYSLLSISAATLANAVSKK